MGLDWSCAGLSRWIGVSRAVYMLGERGLQTFIFLIDLLVGGHGSGRDTSGNLVL